MRNIKDDEFTSAVTMSDLPVLVDFWAPWCGPCRSIGMVLEDLAKEYEGRINIVKIDVSENNKVMIGYDIRAIPTVLGFKAGEMKGKVVASVSKIRLVELIEALLKEE